MNVNKFLEKLQIKNIEAVHQHRICHVNWLGKYLISQMRPFSYEESSPIFVDSLLEVSNENKEKRELTSVVQTPLIIPNYKLDLT